MSTRKNTHTPGPWAFCNETLCQSKGNHLHLGRWTSAPGLGYSADANARLIAAAPDLLAALERLLVDEGLHSVGCKEFPPGFERLETTCCPVKVARAAIAKARGTIEG